MPQEYLKHMRLAGTCNPSTVSVGADPEVLLRLAMTKKDMDFRPYPVCGMLGGTKAKPLAIPEFGAGYAVQEDNVAAEFNIPAAMSSHDFYRRVSHMMSWLTMKTGELPKVGGRQIQLLQNPEALYNSEDLQSPEARTFGCDPDYDAYMGGSMAPRVSPDVLRTSNGEYRFAGGHIHLGWAGRRPEMPAFAIAAFMDAYVTLPTMHHDSQELRRQYYGRAGRYREKSYGVEYRTPSNYWVWNTSLSSEVGARSLMVAWALVKLQDEFISRVWDTIPWEDVKQAINTNDRIGAKALSSYIEADLSIGNWRQH